MGQFNQLEVRENKLAKTPARLLENLNE